MSDDTKLSSDDPSLRPHLQAKLGEKLKEAYADVVNEPVPDRFLELLNQLEASSSKGDEANNDRTGKR